MACFDMLWNCGDGCGMHVAQLHQHIPATNVPKISKRPVANMCRSGALRVLIGHFICEDC